MSQYSEQDLKYAAEFRDGVHKEALAIVRKTRPYITEVIDRHPVEDYFQEHWDYPGKWYTIVAIPYGYGSRKELVDTIVRDTLSGSAPEKEPSYTQELRNMAKTEPDRKNLAYQLDAKPEGYRELLTVDADQKSRSRRTVGVDAEGRHILEHYEEYGSDSGISADYDRLTAESKEDPFCGLIAEYPDLAVDYCTVKEGERYLGYESHRTALKTAWQTCFSADADGEPWQGNPIFATGKRITVEELFSSDYRDGELNYRKAFLYPPHGNGYTGNDFVRVNAALFPNGTDGLEVFRWTTDWSDYFDDGHEWWGTLCLTVYDKSLDRFVVITASATD